MVCLSTIITVYLLFNIFINDLGTQKTCWRTIRIQLYIEIIYDIDAFFLLSQVLPTTIRNESLLY